ncbi:MAG: hypothetical protein AAF725_23295, partial [Acidobacteriota bacterium]
AGVFGYESGAALPGGRVGAFPAPNKRIALALHNDTAPVLTNAGWRIFEASIQWALGGIPHEGDDPGDPCLPDLDFDTDASGVALPQGTVITDQWSAWGLAVTTGDPQDHPAMLFDRASPTGGDADLGAPNQDFGGPGVGGGGAAGAAGENPAVLGKVLIVSEDGDSSDPDDNAQGGQLIFTMEQAAEVASVGVLDVSGGTVTAYGASGEVITSASLVDLGDNGLGRVSLNAAGVFSLVVDLDSSGAVTDLDFCISPADQQQK